MCVLPNWNSSDGLVPSLYVVIFTSNYFNNHKGEFNAPKHPSKYCLWQSSLVYQRKYLSLSSTDREEPQGDVEKVHDFVEK